MSPDLQLEQLLGVLVERFGAARSLGEVYATTYALRTHREGREVTLADVAATTGIPKQNLSRWLQGHIESDQVVTRRHDEDGRVQRLTVPDMEFACRHLPAIAEAFGCAMDADPRESDGETAELP